jgi:uncharacterized membrane protein YkvA (DUF1232 family)
MRARKTSRKSGSTKKAVPKKSGRVRRKPLTKADITRSAYFREAAAKAGSYAKDPEKLRKLFEQASNKLREMPRRPFAEMWAYVMAMIRLVRAYHAGTYRQISWRSFLIIIGALLYLVSPLDVIPDWIPVLGYVDDALVIALALKSVRDDLDAFMEWETEG